MKGLNKSYGIIIKILSQKEGKMAPHKGGGKRDYPSTKKHPKPKK